MPLFASTLQGWFPASAVGPVVLYHKMQQLSSHKNVRMSLAVELGILSASYAMKTIVS
jgi:hypothetical protein